MPNFYNIIRAKKFSTVSDTAIEIAPYNSATPNFSIDAGGKLRWSSGSATADTTLYRTAASALKTDGSIEAATGLTAATPTFSGPLTSAGVSTFQNTVVLQQSFEKVTAGGNLTGITNIDLLTSAIHTYTSTGDFTLNFRGSSSTSLDVLMSNGQSVTAVLFVTNTTARSISAIQVQGTTSGVTTRWFGGPTAPTGNGSSTDAYTITIMKTGSAAYTVYASQSKFA
jgi:hypothetical protein